MMNLVSFCISWPTPNIFLSTWLIWFRLYFFYYCSKWGNYFFGSSFKLRLDLCFLVCEFIVCDFNLVNSLSYCFSLTAVYFRSKNGTLTPEQFNFKVPLKTFISPWYDGIFSMISLRNSTLNPQCSERPLSTGMCLSVWLYFELNAKFKIFIKLKT